jgi:hypothetical protein
MGGTGCGRARRDHDEETAMDTIQIQCHCGAVGVEITGEPLAQFYCHCDDCQLVHGAAYVPASMYRASQVEVIRVFAESTEYGIRGVTALLLPKERFQPQFHIYCQFAILPIRDGLPHFKTVPAAFGGSEEKVEW